MCGIVAHVGSRNAASILVAGLHRLEYRGYDSAGVALYSSGQDRPEVVKTPGKVSDLEACLEASCRETGDGEIDGHADDIIRIPRCMEFVSPIPTVIAEQLLAYHVADIRGCSIDQPRNLAKSVTVE